MDRQDLTQELRPDQTAQPPAIVPDPPAKESRAVHRCEALKRDGRTCGRYVAVIWVDSTWKCPSHRPFVREKAPGIPGTPPRLPRPPVTALTSPSDALRLGSWAAIQLARGRLDHQRANAIAATCREFRQSWREAARVEETSRRIIEMADAFERVLTASNTGDRAGAKAALADAQRLLAELRAA
jgi:hypothetical protein